MVAVVETFVAPAAGDAEEIVGVVAEAGEAIDIDSNTQNSNKNRCFILLNLKFNNNALFYRDGNVGINPGGGNLLEHFLCLLEWINMGSTIVPCQ